MLGPWGFVTVALLAVAVACFMLGLWRERARGAAALREARALALGWRTLHGNWLWRSDAEHRIVMWQGPGDAAASTAPPPDAAALKKHLAAERAFRGVRVTSVGPVTADDAAPGDPSLAAADAGPTTVGPGEGPTAPGDLPPAAALPTQWLLDAEPVQSADARFAGFVGQARADGGDAFATLPATALAALLAALPGAALLARQGAQGLQVQRLNAPAQLAWPRLGVGDGLPDGLPGVPAAVSDALATLVVGQTLEADGWRVTRFAAAAGADGLLLARLAPPPAEADAFGPTLSHDLRAPIRVVEGFTRIVKEDYGRVLDRVANDHLERVLGAAARMNLMIDALLTLARLSSQPLARQPVNLSQLAGYVVEDLRRGTPERSVEVEIEPGLAALGDPTLVRMVLENLIGNAWKYTARVPRARIGLTRGEHRGRPSFAVADNGAGFDMRSADRLFGFFQRLHGANEFAGHGVGLASVKRIVQRHGGEIWASAEPGRGATFSFTLG